MRALDPGRQEVVRDVRLGLAGLRLRRLRDARGAQGHGSAQGSALLLW
jgi:hypothetical protein